jgi:hypothetical protein
MIDPIVEFLLEPQRLALALEIASKRDAVARYIVNTYWRNVANVITEQLPPNDLGDWVFESTDRAEEKHSGIAFVISAPAVTEDTDEHYVYWIGYDALVCDPEEMYLGVCRGARFPAPLINGRGSVLRASKHTRAPVSRLLHVAGGV